MSYRLVVTLIFDAEDPTTFPSREEVVNHVQEMKLHPVLMDYYTFDTNQVLPPSDQEG